MTVLSTDGRRLIFPPPPRRVLDVLPPFGGWRFPHSGDRRGPRRSTGSRCLSGAFFVHSTRGGGAVGGSVSDRQATRRRHLRQPPPSLRVRARRADGAR